MTERILLGDGYISFGTPDYGEVTLSDVRSALSAMAPGNYSDHKVICDYLAQLEERIVALERFSFPDV